MPNKRIAVIGGINRELTSNRTGVISGKYRKLTQKYVVENGKYKKIWQRGNAVEGSQTFTSSGMFTVPEGVVSVDVFCLGGAGGDGYGDITTAGGSGYVANVYNIEVNAGDEIPVVIGAKGANGTSSSSTGSRGGTSSFGSFASAPGGYGGNRGQNGAAGGSGSGCAGYRANVQVGENYSRYFFANENRGWRAANGSNGSDGSSRLWCWETYDEGSTYEKSYQASFEMSKGKGGGVSTIPFGDSANYAPQDNFGANGKVIIRWRMTE